MLIMMDYNTKSIRIVILKSIKQSSTARQLDMQMRDPVIILDSSVMLLLRVMTWGHL